MKSLGNTSCSLQKQDISSLHSLIDNYFKMMGQDDVIRLNHNSLVTFLNLLSDRGVRAESFLGLPLSELKALTSLIVTIKSMKSAQNCPDGIEGNLLLLFDCKPLCNATVKVVYALLRVIYNKKDAASPLGEVFLKIGSTFNAIFDRRNKDTSQNEALNKYLLYSVVDITMKTVVQFADDKNKLQNHFYNVCCIVRVFFNFYSLVDEPSLAHISRAVYHFSSVITVYKKAGLNGHVWTLGQNLIILLRKLTFSCELSISLKNNVGIIVSNFLNASPPVRSFECLVYLIALTEETSPLFDFGDKFKFWNQLKKCPFNKVEDVTVYQVIRWKDDQSLDQTVGAEVNKWPFSIVSQLDYQKLLLLEIQSYLKQRNLKTSVLAVYKTAVGQVKCKLTLARILCCATKFFLENDSDFNFSMLLNFRSSLRSMIKLLSSVSDEKYNDVDKLLVIGDLNYMLARFDIYSLRKDSENKVVKEISASVSNPRDIPRIEDSLNSTILVNEFSFVAYSTQEKVMASLFQAFCSWKKALTVMQGNEEEKLKEFEFIVSFSLKYIKECGYVYRLYKDVKHEATVWQLLFDMSEPLNFVKYKIIAFSELLCVLKGIDQEIVDEMKCYVNSQPDRTPYYFQLFKISMGKNLLYNKKLEESKCFLDDLMTESLESNYTLLVQRGLFSHFLRSAMGIPDYRRPCELIDLFQKCLYQSKNKTSSFVQETIDHCLLFDLALMLGRQFCKIHDPRFARLYSNKQLEMAQAMHLPLRTCELLIVQAEIDILCVDDKNIKNKLSAIRTIMELQDDKCTVHPDSCTCVQCGHVEYQIALAYFILLKTASKRNDQMLKVCLELLKDCREVLSKVKKKSNRNLMSDFFDCEISFSILAAEVLSAFGRLDKALKYSKHALDYIQQSYKPHYSEQSSISLNSTLKLEFKRPKLESTMISQLCSDDESEKESSVTPVMDFKITPPALNWKHLSCNPEKKFLMSNNMVNVKKLVFENSPQYDSEKSTDGNNDSVDGGDVKNQHAKGSNCDDESESGGKTSAFCNDVPQIVILDCSDDGNSESPLQCNSNKLKPRSIKKLVKRKDVFASEKQKTSEFGQDKVNTRPRRNKKQNSSKAVSAITIDSDDELGVKCLTDNVSGTDDKTVKKAVDKFLPIGLIGRKKKLFDTDDSGKDSCSSDASKVSPTDSNFDLGVQCLTDDGSDKDSKIKNSSVKTSLPVGFKGRKKKLMVDDDSWEKQSSCSDRSKRSDDKNSNSGRLCEDESLPDEDSNVESSNVEISLPIGLKGRKKKLMVDDESWEKESSCSDGSKRSELKDYKNSYLGRLRDDESFPDKDSNVESSSVETSLPIGVKGRKKKLMVGDDSWEKESTCSDRSKRSELKDDKNSYLGRFCDDESFPDKDSNVESSSVDISLPIGVKGRKKKLMVNDDSWEKESSCSDRSKRSELKYDKNSNMGLLSDYESFPDKDSNVESSSVDISIPIGFKGRKKKLMVNDDSWEKESSCSDRSKRSELKDNDENLTLGRLRDDESFPDKDSNVVNSSVETSLPIAFKERKNKLWIHDDTADKESWCPDRSNRSQAKDKKNSNLNCFPCGESEKDSQSSSSTNETSLPAVLKGGKKQLFLLDGDEDSNHSDASSKGALFEKKINSSSEDASFIEATICEDSHNFRRLPIGNSTKVSMLVDKMSEFCISSPVALPLRASPGYNDNLKCLSEKVSKRLKIRTNEPKSIRVNKKKLPNDDKTDATPITRKTRSTRRLLL